MTPEEAKKEVHRAILEAQKVNELLGHMIEEYKDDPAFMAKIHLTIAHAIIRNSVCCLSQLGSAMVGFMALLEEVINEGKYHERPGEHSH